MNLPHGILAAGEVIIEQHGHGLVRFTLQWARRLAVRTIILSVLVAIAKADLFPLINLIAALLAALTAISALWTLTVGSVVDLPRRATTRYIITNQRLLVHTGILNKSDMTIPWNIIRSIDVNRDLVSRLFHRGDIVLNTGVLYQPASLVLVDLRRPHELQQRLRDLIRDAT